MVIRDLHAAEAREACRKSADRQIRRRLNLAYGEATLKSVKPSTTTRNKPAVSIPRPRTAVRRPAVELHLTPKERRLLADPGWVTEDEADVIYSLRNRKQPTAPREEVGQRTWIPLGGLSFFPAQGEASRDSRSDFAARYRIRIGGYRVVYRLARSRTIVIERVRTRGQAYRGFPDRQHP